MTTSSKFEWNGELLLEKVKVHARDRLKQAALYVQAEVKRTLNVPGNAKNKASRKKHGLLRSNPGEPPRKQTGNLQKGVAWEASKDGLKIEVGVTEAASYGVPLEEGAPKIKLLPRPAWSITWVHIKGQVRTILTTPMRGGE